MANHQPGFESDRACLGHARPSSTGSWTYCTKLTSVGSSSIAPGWAAATKAAHPTTDVRDETEAGGRPPSTWWFHLLLNFEPWMSLSDSKWQSYRPLWTVKVNTFNTKMDIISVKTGLVIVSCYNLFIKLSFLFVFVVFSSSKCNVITGHICVSEIIWSIMSTNRFICHFKKDMGEA